MNKNENDILSDECIRVFYELDDDDFSKRREMRVKSTKTGIHVISNEFTREIIFRDYIGLQEMKIVVHPGQTGDFYYE